PAAAGGGGVSSLNPDISLILDVALASFSDDAPLQAGDHDPKASGFSLQQAELALTRAVDPYFKVNANIVFTEEGVEVEEAYGSTLALPWNLKARVGKFLTQAGRINPTHPHTWAFVDQPFILSRLFGGEGNSGVGAELSYLTPLPWYVEIIGSMTDAAGAESARSFYGATDLGVSSPVDLQATLAIKQFFDVSPNWSVLWGLSALTGPNSTGPDNRTDIAATDLYIKYRPITHQSYTIVSLQAEWFFRRRGLGADRLIDQGGYAQLFYRFAKEWGAAARYELGTPAKDSAGDVGADYLDPEWTAARHRVTAALTFWPTEFSRIRAQGSVDLPQWRDDPIWAGFLAFEFSIGAHGAHSF
ncbi:MAG TPA: zinc-regulated TonB-dependent outer membrane receptor, partial [Kofleriaceae bacterium]|nr:zinc-regulated TonB-dependent outer membrane receptor [Kofleriaceae bacterium]